MEENKVVVKRDIAETPGDWRVAGYARMSSNQRRIVIRLRGGIKLKLLVLDVGELFELIAGKLWEINVVEPS